MKPSLFAELRRRNVMRAAIAYVAVSWLVMQAGTLIFQTLELPSVVSKALLALLAIGFIPTLAFSWIYELTPEGLKRESEIDRDESITHLTGRKLDYLVIGVMAAVIGLLLLDRFVLLPRQAARAAASGAPSAPASPAAAQPATEPAPAQASIAVLPFVNMSDEKSNEFFSDGISEELLNLLAKIPQLQVIARTSSFAFKGKEIGITEVARQLHVAHVLEGSVRKSGNAVRITAQLINAATDTHLWSQTYDRKLDDIFAIQDEIAADVVKQLKVTLLGAAPKARTTDPEAYALYLQAVQLGRQNTEETFKQSDEVFRKALAIDPRYAPAWADLSGNLVNETGQGLLPTKEGFAQAREAATKALAIDPSTHRPTLGSAGSRCTATTTSLARRSTFSARWRSIRWIWTCCATAPRCLRLSAALDEALALEEAIVRRDPVNVTALSNLGLDQRYAGQLDAAITSYRTMLSLAPGRGGAHAQLGTALLLKGDAQGALAEIEQETSEVWKMIGLPMAYHALGARPTRTPRWPR
jgi:TolB-like protein